MTETITQPQLSPQQRAFTDRFVAEKAGIDLLIAPAGTGKSVVASAVVAAAIKAGARSVLIVSDLFQVAHVIASRSVRHGGVALPLTREWVWSHEDTGDLRWPEVVVAYGATRAVARPPLDEAIQRRDWDLIVIDASAFTPTFGFQSPDETVAWLYRLDADDHRLLVLLDPSVPLRDSAHLPVRVTHWDKPSVGPSTAPWVGDVVPIRYTLTSDEIEIVEAGEAIVERAGFLGLPLDTRLLEDALDSSPLALHSRASALSREIRHIRNRLAHGLPAQGFSALPRQDEQVAQDLADMTQLASDCTAVAELAGQANSDSRFEALVGYLLGPAPRGKHVIMTQHSQTARYLSSRLEASEYVRTIPLGDLLDEEVREQGLIVVAHDAQLKGVELRNVELAVHYDVSDDIQRLQVRLTRFSWDAGKRPPTMAYLYEEPSKSARQRRAVAQFETIMGPGERLPDQPPSGPDTAR